MNAESKGSGAKAVWIVVGALVVLGLICCVGGYFVAGDWVKSTVSMGQEMKQGVEALEASFATTVSDDAVWALEQQGNSGMAMIVGVPEVPEDDDAIAELQDSAWRLYAEAFAEGGPPLSGVAVGKAARRVKSGATHQGQATGWQEHFASAETLEERTGTAPPPVSEFFRKIYAFQKSAEDHAFEEIDGDPEKAAPEDE